MARGRRELVIGQLKEAGEAKRLCAIRRGSEREEEERCLIHIYGTDMHVRYFVSVHAANVQKWRG